MSYYRPLYQPESVDEEESLLQHRLALAGQSNVMGLARFTRIHDVNFTSSFMRYAPPRMGMYQELTPVYGEQCNEPAVTQQSSFESEDGFQTQTYRSFTYINSDASHPQDYRIASETFGSEGQVDTGSQVVGAMPVAQDNQHHDLPTVAARSDLQWLTTSSTDMRTQSPLNTSSPRPKMPPLYPSQSTPPNVSLLPQGPLDDVPTSSAAAIGHLQFSQSAFAGDVAAQLVPPIPRSKKSSSAADPPKKKGTPGRKRKFQDHELTPEEATKRRIRRERNKVAAAKCRNRRRELTDRLQGETDHLEDHQNLLQQEIMTLQQEKEHLEFILAAHTPNCKVNFIQVEPAPLIPDNTRVIDVSRLNNAPYNPSLPVVEEMIGENPSDSNMYFLGANQTVLPTPSVPSTTRSGRRRMDIKLENPVKVENTSDLDSPSMVNDNLPTDLSSRASSFSNATATTGVSNLTMSFENLPEAQESLNTPVCTLATPSYTTGVFTFPVTPTVCSSNTEPSFSIPITKEPLSSPRTPSYSAYSRSSATPQTCSLAHRRRSSSDSLTSPDSVKSHNLLAL